MRCRILLTAATLLAAPAGGYAQTTLLTLNSQPGDYIGQGQQRTLTPADGYFTARANYHNGVRLSFQGFDGSAWWYLDFAAPQRVQLAPGVYEHATRFPFQSLAVPGLDVHGEGRGCNTLTGRFEVFEVTYGPSGEVLTFAADFEQHCEGMGPALVGAIRYNAGPVPSRCTSRTATLETLRQDVMTAAITEAARGLLITPLNQAEIALYNGAPRSARDKLAVFIQRAVAEANLPASDERRIDVGLSNEFTCSAANVLTNISVP